MKLSSGFLHIGNFDHLFSVQETKLILRLFRRAEVQNSARELSHGLDFRNMKCIGSPQLRLHQHCNMHSIASQLSSGGYIDNITKALENGLFITYTQSSCQLFSLAGHYQIPKLCFVVLVIHILVIFKVQIDTRIQVSFFAY